jgi:hypothetical protein
MGTLVALQSLCPLFVAAALRFGGSVSPTVFRDGPYRFYFFSREEPRMHVHVSCPDGEAKFWLEPAIALAQNHGLSEQHIRDAQALVEAHADECRRSWKNHFEG